MHYQYSEVVKPKNLLLQALKMEEEANFASMDAVSHIVHLRHEIVLQSKPEMADNKFLAYSISQADIEALLVGGGRAKLNAEVMMGIDFLICISDSYLR